MAQIKNPLDEVRIPFAKMSFTPDVPSTALSPNEYNDGQNVETDVRGIRSMAGDQQILATLPAGSGAPTFVTGGFRLGGEFWFVVATQAVGMTGGKYYATNGVADWEDITPSGLDTTAYAQNTNITEAWNGTVLFLNDEHNPPMFWPDQPNAVLVPYSNQVPLDIDDITPASATEKLVTFATTQASAPFTVGSFVTLDNVVPRYYNGTWEVTACSTTDVTIICNVSDAYNTGGTVAPQYSWNYNADWTGVYAKFMRLYNTPNVGSILVAGNLTATPVSDPTSTELYPVTVQWSQAFGLNQAPTTWTPTVTNIANQLEVPLRGEALDAFPCNGQFFLCSYWDTVVFSPINYSTTAAPILGVRQFNQGRGLLSSNCWANTDKLVYGIDARDVWVFDGQDFTGLGNQRVKNWLFDQLDPENYDRVFMEVNSQRSQVEIYYPDMDATNGVPNKMISYRYDLDCWNAPRDVSSATFSCEAPIYSVLGVYNNLASTGGSGTGATFTVSTAYDNVTPEWDFVPSLDNGGSGYTVGNTVTIPVDVDGTTYNVTATVATISGTGAITTISYLGSQTAPVPTPLLSSRTVVYAQGVAESRLIQKDQGYEFIGGANIDSVFRRDNIKLLKDYSGKLMVHRILPEVVNIGAVHNDNNEIPIYPSPGNITVKIEGANSVGSSPASTIGVTLAIDADGNQNQNPWAQFDQNAYRVNTIELSNSSNTDIWMCNATTWQFTQVEDDR